FDLQTSHVIPALIRKCLEAKRRDASNIEVWGDGSPTREFLYVEDAAEGICLAAERYDSYEPVNLGSGMEIDRKSTRLNSSHQIHSFPTRRSSDLFDLQTSHVIPALIRKCLEAKRRDASNIEVWGDGSPTREFLYVEDAAEGICLAAERYDSYEPVNLGSGME